MHLCNHSLLKQPAVMQMNKMIIQNSFGQKILAVRQSTEANNQHVFELAIFSNMFCVRLVKWLSILAFSACRSIPINYQGIVRKHGSNLFG